MNRGAEEKEPVWILTETALALHERLLALHGGAPGLRDQGLLESALSRPRQHHAWADLHHIVELAAIYTTAVIRNHPFIDGNKRVAFVIGILFLELNGFRFSATEADAASAVLALAAGTIDEGAYAAFLRAGAKRRKH